MLTKEDFMPARADRVLFRLAPFVSVFFALAAFASIPFGDTLQVGGRDDRAAGGRRSTSGILYVLRDAVAGRVRRHDGGLGLGQQLRAARRAARGRPHDLGRGRHRRLDHGRRAWSTARSTSRRSRAARARYCWAAWIPKWGILTQPLGLRPVPDRRASPTTKRVAVRHARRASPRSSATSSSTAG